MVKSEDKFSNPIRIVAFDANYKLRAMFQSYASVEGLVGRRWQTIQKCCKGETISCLGHYWREVPEEIVIEADEDLGTLSLFDFDAYAGIDRIIYKNSKMKKGETILESKLNVQ